MQISIREAANFLARHVAVFDELWLRRDEDLTDVELLTLISQVPDDGIPGNVLQKLKELRFLAPTATEGAYRLAPTFARWMEYLQQVARPVSSSSIQGTLQNLDQRRHAFRLALDQGSLESGREELADAWQQLRTLGDDLEMTRAAVATVVAEEKSEHRKQGTRERYRRINRLWEAYVKPIIHLLDPTGPLEQTAESWDRLLVRAMESGFLPDRRG